MNNLSLLLRGKLYDFSRPMVMTIVNVTPDSFFEGSRATDIPAVLNAVEKALNEGADMIDLGGYSTRPGAAEVSEEEELKRVSEALIAIRKRWPDLPVSVDTFRARVARESVEKYGADIINDISGGDIDADMLPTVAELNAPYILMHMRGTPQTKQQFTDYKAIVPEMLSYFSERIEKLRKLGFTKEVIIDPGFGFSKTLEQNYEVMRGLDYFHAFNAPLLVGISRKTMIFKLLGGTPAESLNGTTVLNTYALMHGAHILRVHDTKAAVEAIKICGMLKNS
ncbi:MAG: dihydropteroate synthase [Paludibacteraceae bacterium]|nr:dihydropteroate synthase [Paludibacteraceae bacterium]